MSRGVCVREIVRVREKDIIVVLYYKRMETTDVGHRTSARLPMGSSVYVNEGNKKTINSQGGKKRIKKNILRTVGGSLM